MRREVGALMILYGTLRGKINRSSHLGKINLNQRTGEKYQNYNGKGGRRGCPFALSRLRTHLVANEPVNRAMRQYNQVTEADNEIDIIFLNSWAVFIRKVKEILLKKMHGVV